MNKKMIAFVAAVLIAVLAVVAVVAMTGDAAEGNVQTPAIVQGNEADAAVEEQANLLYGVITEIGEGYFVMQDAVMGDIQVNLGDDTLFEGVELEGLAVGQYVQVTHDGKMTRSLPPQVYALKVGMYPVEGEVVAIEDGAMTVKRADAGDEVIVFLSEGAPEIAVGSSVIAYTNGAMTMSLPAQTTAIGVVVK